VERFDFIVIGSGQGGDPFARACAEAGHKTALIERQHVGGTCINTGCTPTKTMVASARVAYLAKRAADYGVDVGTVRVDMDAVRHRKRKIVEEFREGSERKDTHTRNLELIRGEAGFIGPKSVLVKGRTLTAEHFVIDTGARPLIPSIPGLCDTPFLDNESIMELESVPEHLIVLGGGYIAVEFGQMFRRFGSQVTLIERGTRLLEHEDEDISRALTDIFVQDGIKVMAEAEVIRVSSGPTVSVRQAGKTCQVNGSHLLIATGRKPNTDHLGLDKAGVNVNEHGWIPVNDRLETSAEGIYAIGDVNGGPQFTHISYDDFRILKANLLEGADAGTRGRLVPYTVFTDPQLGRVGMTEREAANAKVEFKVAKLSMGSVARALEVDESRGFMKAIYSPATLKILGFAVLGIEGGEIMNMMQIAMMGGLPFTALRDGIFSHPTLGEAFNNLFVDA
jgi:pyruvate/2-oxoglutarate dehydrogenase complex dihydrolipoamide dehydrogenase (E3) component